MNDKNPIQRLPFGMGRPAWKCGIEIGAVLFALVLVTGQFARAQNFKVLHRFESSRDGSSPYSTLITDDSGNLYGTTEYGGGTGCGGQGCGTVFKVDKTGKEMVLYRFTGTGGDGWGPIAGVIRDTAGNLYGTTGYGGVANCPDGCGTVYKLDKAGKETVLYSFTGTGGDGYLPGSALIRDATGNFYGTTEAGGITCLPHNLTCGTVYKVDPAGKETVLYTFTGTAGDGAIPRAELLAQDAEGNIYSTTDYGGLYPCNGIGLGCGTVFKLDPTGKETVLYDFAGTEDDSGGTHPLAGVIRDKAGNLYGTTETGGTGCQPVGCGTVYKLDPAGKETVLYAFTGINGDGANVNGGVIRDKHGNFYGTTSGGGGTGCTGGGCGTIYKLDAAGKETVLHKFNGNNGAGIWPSSSLTWNKADSLLYGVTPQTTVGSYGGSVYQITP